MSNSFGKLLQENLLVNQQRTFIGILIGIAMIIGLSVFQDYLIASRNGYSFFLSESLLFKVHWLLFIPFTCALNYFFRKYKTIDKLDVLIMCYILAIVLHLVLFSLLGSIFSNLYYEAHFGPYKFLIYAIEHDLLSVLFVYLLVVLLAYYSSKEHPSIDSEPSKVHLDKIIVHSGKSQVVLHLADVYQIRSESPYICIQLENKSYLHNETLKSFLEQSDESKFVRVHKTCIVNISKVVSFTSRLNGDYDLYLANGEIVRVSRNYATDFKMKMHNTPQLKQ
ncbi:LytR/AlgR family response regulator transcription factor [Sphingobacterium lactis]|uniref:LytR/AlgR family response regulator transcription factor n=1 Tax=Sphingobacterium lactis TaxID=797291 RepID=UPI003F7E54E6